MTPRPPTPRSAEAEALRIVFFGTPRSGKTSLLEAFERLASAEAETEPVQLKHAHLADPVRRELIPQIVLVDLPDANLAARAVLLLDCDGEAAATLLNQPGQLARSKARGELAMAIRQADALVLIVEARSKEGEIEAHFHAFKNFLDSLRSGRTFNREVAGWPIFLTLTKSDQLHEPGMSARNWLERVDRETENLRAHFVEEFGEEVEEPGDPLSFGSLQLSTEATATSLPEGLRIAAYDLDDGTLEEEPIVTRVLTAAADFRQRSRAARKRLRWTAAGAVALLALMLALLIGLYLAGEASPLEKLTARVESLQAHDEPAEQRLAEKNLPRRQSELERIVSSPEFDSLPEHLQRFVRSRVGEIEAYREYKRGFAASQISPADVRTQGMFDKLQQDLDGKLAPPAVYAQEWTDTEAVRLQRKWRDDLRLLGEYEDRVQTWYRELIADATGLVLNAQQPGWRAQIGRVMRDAGQPPFLPAGLPPRSWADQPVPSSQRLLMPRGVALTFGAVFQYERADFARRDWELAERRLLDLRDLTDALGLTTDPDLHLDPSEPAAVLNLPEPNGSVDASRALAGRRLEILKKRFPRAANGVAYWQSTTYPEPLQQELSRRLRLAAETGLRHVRFLLDDALKLDNGRPDTPADWRKLIEPPNGLLLQADLRSWGRFLQLLLAWSDPGRGGADPVAELTEFLKTEKFSIPISAVDVYLPNSLRVQVLAPDGVLQLTVPGGPAPGRVLALKLSGEVNSDANGSQYRFVPAVPLAPLEYRPGEGFTAGLPLKAGMAKYLLRWTRSRTNTFAFEKLLLDPDLERVPPAEKAQRVPGVRVKILPEKPGGLVPELLPTTTGID